MKLWQWALSHHFWYAKQFLQNMLIASLYERYFVWTTGQRETKKVGWISTVTVEARVVALILAYSKVNGNLLYFRRSSTSGLECINISLHDWTICDIIDIHHMHININMLKGLYSRTCLNVKQYCRLLNTCIIHIHILLYMLMRLLYYWLMWICRWTITMLFTIFLIHITEYMWSLSTFWK